MSRLTGTWTELIYANRADFTAYASSNTEGSIISGLNLQPAFPSTFFDGVQAFGKTITILARGVISTTGAPTFIFQARLSSTVGTGTLSGASIGVSAAITCGTGVTNKYWELRLDLTCDTPGQGTGNTTLSGAGYVMSPTGFVSPFIYPLEITTPDTATWTQTIDNTLTQYLNLSGTWSANSGSNTLTCKQLLVGGLN